MDAKHLIILPGRQALTRLIVDLHKNAGHAGPSYTLMINPPAHCLIHGISSVKHYIAECASCCLYKAKLVRQLMADLLVAGLLHATNRSNTADWIIWALFVTDKTVMNVKHGACYLFACVLAVFTSS